MEKNKFQQSILVTIPNLTGIGPVDTPVTLNKKYDRWSKVEVYIVDSSGIANDYFRLGFADDGGDILQLAHINSYTSNANVPPNQKGKDVTFRLKKGQNINIKTYLPAALTADLVYEVVFTLEEDGVSR